MSGGVSNVALDDSATVGGGRGNTASQGGATVNGGVSNTANGVSTTVAGGIHNTVSAGAATVGGGVGNQATAQTATVSGGGTNIASGFAAMIPGGYGNIASGDYSFAGGTNAQTQTVVPVVEVHPGAFVWADSTGLIFHSVAANEFAVKATGGVRFVTAIDINNGNSTKQVSIDTNGNVFASGVI